MRGVPTSGAAASAMMTDVSRMNGSGGVNGQSAARESRREPRCYARPGCRMAIPPTSPGRAQLEPEELERVALATLPERVELAGVGLEPCRHVQCPCGRRTLDGRKEDPFDVRPAPGLDHDLVEQGPATT